MTNPDHPRVLTFVYTNWRGETATRQATPTGMIYWGSNQYHPQRQWLFDAFDHEKLGVRTFALSECDFTVNPKTPDTRDDIAG